MRTLRISSGICLPLKNETLAMGEILRMLEWKQRSGWPSHAHPLQVNPRSCACIKRARRTPAREHAWWRVSAAAFDQPAGTAAALQALVHHGQGGIELALEHEGRG